MEHLQPRIPRAGFGRVTTSAAAAAAGGVLVGAGAVLACAVRTPSCTLLAPSVHRGTATRRAVAITFDDGPSESTPELLDVLSKYKVRATFFQCGASVRRLPDIARQVG